ncbi:hypothetical protein SHIRM173S_02323 [Streptomyces hirsutus]
MTVLGPAGARTPTPSGFATPGERQREETGYRTQDSAVERLTELYADRKKTSPSAAEARRELGQQTIEEYAQTWLPKGSQRINMLI